ncbi:MAG: hypothetical protein JSW59_17795 [Phycisphaerales bacterium]|nr:MAG: hypothetical protein JSW59_17795 [Phycisphaerales bacterium]
MTLHKLNILVATQHQMSSSFVLKSIVRIAPASSSAEGFCDPKDVIYTLESLVVVWQLLPAHHP